MFKYEIQIENFNQRYRTFFADFSGIFDSDHASTEYSIPHRFDINAIKAVEKYYTFVEGQGYIKIKQPKVACGIDRSDRDLFEKNNIVYPHDSGLYLLGQTNFHPFTDEKFYWVKVGCADDLKNRRRYYATHTAMIWDIDYRLYRDTSLTESYCHESLKNIALYRHADEWFAIPREIYLNICSKGFKWFEET